MTNKTQCPNCSTVYIITDEQFKKSKGKVRCGTCRQPFAANFLPSTESKPEKTSAGKQTSSDQATTQLQNNLGSSADTVSATHDVKNAADSEVEALNVDPGSEGGFSESTKSFFEEPLSEASLAELMRNASDEASISSVSYSFGFEENIHSEMTIEIDGHENKREKTKRPPTADLIAQVDELIDEKLVADVEETDYLGLDDSESEYEGFRIAEGTFPEGSPFADGSLSAEGSQFAEGSLSADGSSDGDELLLDKPFTLDRRSPLRKVLTWVFAPLLLIAIVAMLALLVYQLWLRQAVPVLDDERIAEKLQPYTSILKEKVDEHFDWQIPVRRDLSNLRLISARVEPHPDRPSTTLLKVSVSNKSSIAQPFPWLELVLTDENGRLVSRRALPPTDYLHNNRLRDVVRANELRQVTIELLAFPRQAHGYELKILNR